MTLRLPKLYIAWTRFKLNLAVRLIASVNRQAASAYALWDDAQDTMERCVPEPKTLHLSCLASRLSILSHRANERAEDITAEEAFKPAYSPVASRKRRMTA